MRSLKKQNKQLIPDSKELTERGHVVITDRERETANKYVKSTKLWYELDEEEKKPGRPKKEEK
ncbi:MAG: hypothetical protein ACOC2F_00350 [Bacteroidota bacterium]